MSSDLCDLVCSRTAITSSSLNSRQKKKASTYEPTCFPRCHLRCPFHIFRTVFVSEIYPGGGGGEEAFPFVSHFFHSFPSTSTSPWRVFSFLLPDILDVLFRSWMFPTKLPLRRTAFLLIVLPRWRPKMAAWAVSCKQSTQQVRGRT